MLARTLSLLALVAAPAAAQDVLVVGSDGFTPFLSIRDAIQVASPGSLIIVRPGVYPEAVRIGSKPLQIVAPVPGSVTVLGDVDVRGLPADGDVLLHGLRIEGSYIEFDAAVELRDCEGRVTLQSCHVLGSDAWMAGDPGQAALGAVRSPYVTAIRCTLEGGDGVTQTFTSGAGAGGAGVFADASRVELFGCTANGGDGEDVFPLDIFDGGRGGHGLDLRAAAGFVSGGTFRGGAGGAGGSTFTFPVGGDGGNGITVGTGSMLVERGPVLVGGPGGPTMGGPPGATGSGIAGPGQVFSLPGVPRLHEGDVFVRGQSIYDFVVTGPANANVGLVITPRAPFFFRTRGAAGGLTDLTPQLRPDGEPIPLGTTDALGRLQASLGIPLLPASPSFRPLAFTMSFDGRSGPSGRGNPIPVVTVNCDALLPDCDGSGRADLCEFLEGTLDDANGNLVPDSCEIDCNGNGVADFLDILNGTSLDLDGDGVPDEC
ncbi:MAG: hypothetical protein AAF957_10875 [Planctomycetota bacterium]